MYLPTKVNALTSDLCLLSRKFLGQFSGAGARKRDAGHCLSVHRRLVVAERPRVRDHSVIYSYPDTDNYILLLKIYFIYL